MARRRQETPIAKPDIVLANAYKKALTTRLEVKTPDLKIGDHLARMDEYDGFGTWRAFAQEVAEKFAGKSFSRSHFWIACLKQNINPLHLIPQVKEEERRLNVRASNFGAYEDGAHDHPNMKEAFRKLDKLVTLTLDFKAPYEGSAWFGKLSLDSKEDTLRFTMAKHVIEGNKQFHCFVAHSERAESFCHAFIDSCLAHTQGKEQADMIAKLMDSICETGLSHDNEFKLVLNENDVKGIFQSCLALLAEKFKNSSFDRYSTRYYMGKYFRQAYLGKPEMEGLLSMVGATGVNGLSNMLGAEFFKNPELIAPLIEQLEGAQGDAFFQQALSDQGYGCSHEEKSNAIEAWDATYQLLGKRTLYRPELLVGASHDLKTVQLLSERGVFDYKAILEHENFQHNQFCSHRDDSRHDYFHDRAEIERFIELCVTVGAQSHLEWMINEDLTKGFVDKRLLDNDLRRDFYEVLLESRAIPPDEILKTPLRIEKLIALGVSPKHLQASKKYSDKWVDKSFGVDLGL